VSLALLDCPTGLAGNMLLAALLDLGLPEAVIHAPLAALGLTGRYRLQIEERRSGGLRGLPPAGHGSVSTAHGSLPLPAPAVLEIARRRGIPLASSEGFPAGELTTPTGLALIACWAERFGPAPAALPLQVGVGLGSRCLDRPNLLRLTLAQAPFAAPLSQQQGGGDATAGPEHGEWEEPLLVQQAQIDDATAEDLAFLATALRQAGAVEVFSQAIAMKKGRQGTLLTALLPPPLGPALRQVWWRHGTTLGVREQLQQRWILPRDGCRLDTALGPVRLKRSHLPDGRVRLKPEHDDLADLARRHDLSLEQVRAEVRQRIETGGAIEAPSGEEP